MEQLNQFISLENLQNSLTALIILICVLTQYFKDIIDNISNKLFKKVFPTKYFVFILCETLLFSVEYLSNVHFNGEVLFITSIKGIFISIFAMVSVEKMMKKKSKLDRDLTNNEIVEIVSEDLLNNGSVVNNLVSSNRAETK